MMLRKECIKNISGDTFSCDVIFDMMLRKECLKKDLKGGFWCGCHEDSELGMLRFRSSAAAPVGVPLKSPPRL